MRKILIGGIAAVVVLLAAALLVPSFIDWNQYKDRVQREAEAATGRKLTIAGDIDVSVLPFPKLRVKDVRFANAAGAAVPNMASLKALEVDVAFWPLLRGQVETTRVTLVEPVIELQTLADGSGNWTMRPAVGSPQPAAPAATPSSTTTGGDGLPVRLDNISIENGTVVWRDGQGTAERIERINVRASAESLQGPFRAAGDLILRGVPATLDADVGRLAPQATTPIRASLNLKDARAGLVLTANLGPEAPARRIDGTAKLEAQSMAGLVAAILGAPAGPARPLSVDATFVAEGGRFKADPLAVRIDDAELTGRIESAPDRSGRTAVTAVLSTPRIDVDKWRTVMAPAAAPSAKAPEKAPPPAAAAFSLPPGITARLDLTAGTIVAQGQSVRNARLVAQLADGKVTVERAAAELPGPTAIVVTGTLAAAQGQPQFDGRVQLDARNLRTLLFAYKVAPDGLPADRLGRAMLQARIKANPRLVEVTDLAAGLDGMKATGGATVRLADGPGTRPAVGAKLAVDKIDLDPYLRRVPKPAVPAAPPPTGVSPPPGPSAPAVDLDLEANVGQLVFAGKTARNLVVAGAYQGGTVTLRQLAVGDYAGASGKIAGTVRDLGPAAAIDLTLEASGRDLGQVLSQGGVAAPAQAQQPFSLGGKLSGTAARLAVDLAARLGDGQAKIAGTVEPPRGLPGVALAVDASHPSAGRLLSQLSPGYRPRGGDIGPFRLTAKTRADGSTLFLDGFSLAAGPARLEGPVRIETGGPRPKLIADLTGGELSVDAFMPVEERADYVPPEGPALLPGVMLAQARSAPAARPAPRAAERWSKAPLDLSALQDNDADVKLRAASFQQGRWVVSKPDVAVTLADGTLSLAKFTGQVHGGAVEMTGRLVAKGVPNVRFDLRAENVNLGQAVASGGGGVRLAGGRTQANLTAETTGRSIHEMVSALGGKGDLDVRDGTLRGVNLSAVAKSVQSTDLTRLPDILGIVQELGKDGDTAFSSMTGTFRIEKGVVRSEDLKLAAAGFTATGTTVTSLPAWTTDTRVEARIATKPEPVPVAVRLEGPLDEPRKIFDTNALQAYLASRVGAGGLQQLLPGVKAPSQPGQQPQKPGNLLDQLPGLLRR